MMTEDGFFVTLTRKNFCLKINLPTFKQLPQANMQELLVLELGIGKEDST